MTIESGDEVPPPPPPLPPGITMASHMLPTGMRMASAHGHHHSTYGMSSMDLTPHQMLTAGLPAGNPSAHWGVAGMGGSAAEPERDATYTQAMREAQTLFFEGILNQVGARAGS